MFSQMPRTSEQRDSDFSKPLHKYLAVWNTAVCFTEKKTQRIVYIYSHRRICSDTTFICVCTRPVLCLNFPTAKEKENTELNDHGMYVSRDIFCTRRE
jgi:hypothetical protein